MPCYYTESGGVHVKLENLEPSQANCHRYWYWGSRQPAAEVVCKFYRADNAKQVRRMAPAGLYLAKRVIEDQGGQLIFTSVEGKGTFGFTLPRS